jgi:hypothetical protein
MVVNIFLDSNFDVNTIINLNFQLPNEDVKQILVNDFDLDDNPNYIKAFLDDNTKDTALCFTLLNKNDIWHKRKVFIQLYWLLDSLNEKYKISEIHLKDGFCNARVNNIFYSDGERNFSLLTSPVYNINRVVKAFVASNQKIKVTGNKEYFLPTKQFFRELSFVALSVMLFIKIFFLNIKIIKSPSSNTIAISRAYAHAVYFKQFINSNLIISENYSIISLFRNIFSFRFWKILTYFLKTSIKNLHVGNLSIEPHAKYSKLELITKYLQSSPMTLLYLANNIEKEKKHIISAELLTAHSAILYIFAIETNSKLSIIQTVSLFKINNFYFNYCHNFLFENYSMYKWFSEKHKNPVNYKFEGNGYVKREKGREVLDEILYISQPSLKTIDLDYQIIERVNIDKKIDVRLHPRDSNNRYNGLSVQQGRSFSIDKYDMIITRTSSMAVQAIYLNTPVVYCLFDDWSRNNDLYYITNNYYGIAKNLNELITILNNYDKLIMEFEKFRKDFLNNNSKKDKFSLKKYLKRNE